MADLFGFEAMVANVINDLGHPHASTGIHNSQLSRFLRGERGLSMDAIDTLGEYLGLRVVRDEG